jgi:chromosome segregation ATPase
MIKNKSNDRHQLIINDLQATILALRERLEESAYEVKRAEQSAILSAADEIQQLKNTASSLRSELESLQFEKDAAVQREVQRSADEIQQLKNTASSLRSELEKVNKGRA